MEIKIRDLVQSMPKTRETVAAKYSLEKQLYTVQELFERFAIPLDLPEIKLALCFCSSTYNESAIEEFYIEIIDKGYFFESLKSIKLKKTMIRSCFLHNFSAGRVIILAVAIIFFLCF